MDGMNGKQLSGISKLCYVPLKCSFLQITFNGLKPSPFSSTMFSLLSVGNMTIRMENDSKNRRSPMTQRYILNQITAASKCVRMTQEVKLLKASK